MTYAEENDPETLALAALGWIMSNEDRGQRFLDLTGLTPDRLRNSIAEAATHRAVFAFLESYESDLIAAAIALEIAPEKLARAGQELER